MEGDLTQIKAKNYEGLDRHLSISEKNIKGNETRQTSLFESNFKTYKKPTNFSINTRIIQSDNKFDFNQKIKFTLPKYGDKIHKMYLEIKLPTLSNVGYVNVIGYSLIEYIDVEIGGNRMDRLYDTWMDIHDKLMTKTDYRNGIDEMILRFTSHTDESFKGGTVIVPINLWFCESLSQSFPIGALTQQDIILYVKLKPFNNIWMSNNGLTPSKTFEITTGHLLVDYVRLDKIERQLMINNKHKYLMKQVQLVTKNITQNATSVKINLDSINHPVTELIWVIRSDNRITEKDWFNYKDTTTLADDPMLSAYLTFGEKDRLEEHSSYFYRMIQPLGKHSNIPNDYIYMYSFSAKPEFDTQPTGTCNFSELNNVNLHLKLKTNLSNSTIFVYAINYNVLLVENGFAWLEKIVAI